MAWWDQEEPEPFRMYAQMAQNVPPPAQARERPADTLWRQRELAMDGAQEHVPLNPLAGAFKWARDQIPENKGLPAPEFFMDPRSLSMQNMLRGGLENASRWMQAGTDPSVIRPQEMISPLGLAGMATVGTLGTGMKTALTAPSRDFRIAEELGKQHPRATAGGDMFFTSGGIGVRNGPQSIFGLESGTHGAASRAAKGGDTRVPRPDPAIYGVADNINTAPRGYAPPQKPAPAAPTYTPDEVSIGDMQRGRIAGHDRIWVSGSDGMTPATRVLAREANGAGRRIPPHEPPANDLFADNARSSLPGTLVNAVGEGQRAKRPLTEWEHEVRDMIERPRFSGTPSYPMTPEQRAAQFAEWQAESAGIVRRAKDGVYSNRKVPTLRADNAAASSPGLAANGTQQDAPAVMDILRRHGLLAQ